MECVKVTECVGFSSLPQLEEFDAVQPIVNVPGGTNNISICVAVSRTRHARPVAEIAARMVALVTTAGLGASSISVAQLGTDDEL